jgi:hypothetical protein
MTGTTSSIPTSPAPETQRGGMARPMCRFRRRPARKRPSSCVVSKQHEPFFERPIVRRSCRGGKNGCFVREAVHRDLEDVRFQDEVVEMRWAG